LHTTPVPDFFTTHGNEKRNTTMLTSPSPRKAKTKVFVIEYRPISGQCEKWTIDKAPDLQDGFCIFTDKDGEIHYISGNVHVYTEEQDSV
jgi:hypothetical protein